MPLFSGATISKQSVEKVQFSVDKSKICAFTTADTIQ